MRRVEHLRGGVGLPLPICYTFTTSVMGSILNSFTNLSIIIVSGVHTFPLHLGITLCPLLLLYLPYSCVLILLLKVMSYSTTQVVGILYTQGTRDELLHSLTSW